jgi:hypothetical protein
MKVYLAARYSRYPDLQHVARELVAMGHEITSRWIKGDHQISDAGLSSEAKAFERARFATEDLADLLIADCCISFTETPRGTNSRGGRHVEYGIALGLAKRLIVVGPRENVFHCLPHVEVYPAWADCRDALTRERLREEEAA